MRRLPVFLVLDTSGSMSGEPIQAVKNGVQMLVSALRQDPQALETAFDHLRFIRPRACPADRSPVFPSPRHYRQRSDRDGRGAFLGCGLCET